MRIEAQRRPVASTAGTVPRTRADVLVGAAVGPGRDDGDDLGPDEPGAVLVGVDEQPVARETAGDERHGPVEAAEAVTAGNDTFDRDFSRHRTQSPRRVSGARPKAFLTARRLIAE